MNPYFCLVLHYRRKTKEQDKLEKLKSKTKKVEARIEEIDSAIQLIKELCAMKGMNEEGLYLCKKCGGKPSLHRLEGYDISRSIRCRKCDSSVYYDGDDEDGVDKWNRENEKGEVKL